MINSTEVHDFAQRFGVPAEQIRRDHLISHALVALESNQSGRLVFFGGTALCRTWLPDLRYSEDIDLLVETLDQSEGLRRSISLGLRNDFPNATWTKVGLRHDVETWNLTFEDLTVKVQFALWRTGWEEAIPQTTAPIELRYSDLPDTATFIVPTASGFAAMKLIAWLDRSAPRDIYDLAALAEADMIDNASLKAAKKIIGYEPKATMITNVPMGAVRSDWESELVHQISNPKSLDGCIDLVRRSLEMLDK
ncbi:MAG: putative nucleotidyltransferase component of viral defense system [Verrucomicrobiales bacterium]|jgi:predicted nucleotidyltransferase component of viral defense system